MLPKISTGNPLMRGSIFLAIGYMRHQIERVVDEMKEGNPPLDLSRKSYLVPEI